MNPNISSEIQITLPPRPDGNWQSIWSRRRSNEYSKEGDSHVRSVKSYRQVKSQHGGSLPRHVPTSQMPTEGSVLRHAPTSLPRSRPWSLPRNRPRFYQSRLPRSQQWCRPDGHQSGLPKTITETMPITDEHRLQDIFSRGCGSTPESSDSASSLELGKYNHLEKLTC